MIPIVADNRRTQMIIYTYVQREPSIERVHNVLHASLRTNIEHVTRSDL